MRAVLLATALAVAAPSEVSASPRPPVRSMLELRRDGVVQQRWDLSCGAAALSTLLTYDQGDRVTEEEVVAGLLQHADPERIRRQGGFTLLDLKRYATARGYVATGYQDLSSVAAAASLAPAIVPTVVRGQPHFMVLRGIAQGRVVLSDPAYGNRTMTAERFEALWSPRVAFVVRRPPGGPGDPRGREPRATIVPDVVLREAARGTP
ncbi:MAG TPA: cysteine peptidase family C39 domain-containing protein [Anaeromyxobacter sp.]